MKLRPFAIGCSAILVWGCATTAATRVATQPLSNPLSKSYVVAAITRVLTSNGFGVAAVDEKQGTVRSEWRTYADSDDAGLNLLTSTVHSRELLLSFRVSVNEYTIMPRVKLKAAEPNGSTREDIKYVRKDSTEESVVMKIVEEINKQINEPNNIQWISRIDLSSENDL